MKRINQINRNDVIDIKIDHLNDRFEGISEVFDITSNKIKKLIVPNSIPEEVLKVKILKAEKNSLIVFCKVLEYIDPVSEKRNFNFNCNNSGCPGCDFSHLNYVDQVETKKSYLEKELFPSTEVFYEFENYKELEYRSKINLPIKCNESLKKFVIGLYKKNSHEIVDFKSDCLIIDDQMNKIIYSLKKILNKKNTITKLTNSSISLTNLFIRGSKEFGYQVGLSFNCQKGAKSYKRILNEILLKLHEVNKGFVISTFINHQNEDRGNSIVIDNADFMNEGFDKFVKIKVLNRIYKVSPESFFQLNIVTLETILNDLKHFFKDRISSINQVFDFFSGVGVLSDIFEDIYLEKKCTHSINRVCLESNKSSFKYLKKAEEKQEKDNLHNINSIYEVMDMNDEDNSLLSVLDNFKLKNPDKNINDDGDLFIFDPPRKGIGTKSLDIIEKYNPKYIVYLSCNPKTLQKDLQKILSFNKKYKIQFFKGFDMFPQTSHIESLVVIERC